MLFRAEDEKERLSHAYNYIKRPQAGLRVQAVAFNLVKYRKNGQAKIV